jgi:UDP-3-O-acyl N-acetylglucosamine deacetylase
LYDGGTSIEMVEHVMAALAGLRIDNCEVWADGPEMPGCDGSSLPFVAALESAGIVEQDALRPHLVVSKQTCVGDRRCWVEARPSETPGLTIHCFIDYGSVGPIGRQTFTLHVTPDSFRDELAAARTYVLQEEAEWLRSQGLGARVTCRDLLVFDNDGPIDNALRFDDECVRHKTLDLVGDLALAGCDLVGHITAYCSGHRLNAELVKALLAEGHITTDLRRTG